ncbi:hypothetical protein [Variovorax sp.]|uniref:hypothetical protein n=1 Tax=Variovorax sp. TaxID=1871043 RepID=UPI0040378717
MRRRISRRLATLIDWTWIAVECALLLAWKAGEVQGAGNVLAAWIVITGVLGIGMFLPATQFAEHERPLPYAYGWKAIRFLGVALAVALLWYGHGLLALMQLLGEAGVQAFRKREQRAMGARVLHRHEPGAMRAPRLRITTARALAADEIDSTP